MRMSAVSGRRKGRNRAMQAHGRPPLPRSSSPAEVVRLRRCCITFSSTSSDGCVRGCRTSSPEDGPVAAHLLGRTASTSLTFVALVEISARNHEAVLRTATALVETCPGVAVSRPERNTDVQPMGAVQGAGTAFNQPVRSSRTTATDVLA
jgi:hypothetical protein